MTDVSIVPRCRTKGCLRSAALVVKTGLCLTCHSRAKKMVEAGTTTWAELTKLGLALSPDNGDDPFTQAFNEAKKNYAGDN